MLEARNAGKPIGDARGEMGDGRRRRSATTRARPERLLGDTIPVAGGVAMTFREPLGVVGADHAVELPADDRRVEARAGAGGRQHGRAQAGRADAADRAASSSEIALEAGLPEGVVNVVAGPGRTVRRSGSSSTPTSPRSRSPARPRSARSIAARRRADDQARDARARRQVGQRRLRRRRHRGRRGGRAGRRVRQRRPGLLRALAHPRRARRRSTRSWTRSRRPSRRSASATRSTRRPQMGPLISAGQRETVASFVPDDAPVAIRGTAPDGPGYWFPPTVLCPVDPRRPRRARGDLRPGRGA